MSRAVTGRLCLMMYLEFAVRGMWFPFLANYLRAGRGDGGLGFSSGQAGWVVGFAGAVGAISAPFVGGRLADRHLNAERALAALHCGAAALLFANASSRSFPVFLALMVCFSVAYAPTQSLTTSLAVSHLADRERQFPRVRLWGTIGWITTSALFTFVVLRSPSKATNVARIPMAMRAAGAMAVGYAAYAAFLLPPTPPMGKGDVNRAGLGAAFGLLRRPSVLALTLVAIPVSMLDTAYYLNIGPFLNAVVGVPLRWVGPTMALAQVSEVGCLFVLGPMLRRLGYARVLLIGTAAEAARFVVFALDPPGWVVLRRADVTRRRLRGLLHDGRAVHPAGRPGGRAALGPDRVRHRPVRPGSGAGRSLLAAVRRRRRADRGRHRARLPRHLVGPGRHRRRLHGRRGDRLPPGNRGVIGPTCTATQRSVVRTACRWRLHGSGPLRT